MSIVPIHLSSSSPDPLYVQVADQLASAIREGEIAPGERLPSVRELARQLEVNKVTVVNAYRRLVGHGLAVQKVGSGTFACSSVEPLMDRPEHEIPSGAIDLATAMAPPDLFPMDDLQGCINQVLQRDGYEALEYGEVQGYGPLRDSLGEYVGARGIPSNPEGLHVVSGSQQGLDLMAKAALSPGDTVVVESPGYPGARACFQARGCQVEELSLGPEGPDGQSLKADLDRIKPRLVYVNPDYQNPTGARYPLSVRQALLESACRNGFWILEDDFCSDLRYEGEPFPAIASMEGQDRVIFMKSLSALTLPGLRLAILVVPPEMTAAVTRAKYLADIATGGLIQRAFDLFIREGHWKSHIRRLREECSLRYRIATRRATDLMPQVQFHPPGGGLHLWLKLPAGIDADRLEARARGRGVCILAGSAFGGDSQHIRLSFSGAPREDLATALHVLSRVIQGGSSSRRPLV